MATEVLKQIIAREKEGHASIESANERARMIVKEAQEQARKTTSDAIDAARHKCAELIRHAETEARTHASKILADARHEIERLDSLAKHKQDKVLKHLLSRISGVPPRA